MRDRKVCYRWINFFVPDYKALEMYLDELACQGYELMRINFVGIGIFERREDVDVEYTVIVDKKEMPDKGELIKKVDCMFIFKIRKEDLIEAEIVKEELTEERMKTYQKLDSETKRERYEEKLTLKEYFKLQVWSILMGLIWSVYGISHMYTLGEWDLLSNISLSFPVLISMIGVMSSGYNLYFLYTCCTRIKKSKGINVSAARWRSKIYMLILGVITITMLIILVIEVRGIGRYLIPYLIILFASAKVYSQPGQWMRKAGIGFVLFIAPIVFGFLMLHSSFSTMGRQSAQNHVRTQQWIDTMNLLNIGIFVDQNQYMEHRIIEEAESLLISAYYEYKGHAGSGEQLSYDYYKGRNLWAAEKIMELLVEKYVDDEWHNKKEEITFSVDEIYINREESRLLLRKGKEIYCLITRYINLENETHIKIIEEFIKDRGEHSKNYSIHLRG